jgi:hypothetical protein
VHTHKRHNELFSRRWVWLGIPAIVVLGLIAACDDASKKKLNHAAALGWREYVQTDLAMSEFYAANFTLAARIMVQYPKAYVGPIMAASGGGFELSKDNDATTLVARYGNTLATYGTVDLQAGKWHHLALVRTNNSLALFLDGQSVCPMGMPGCAVAVDNVTPTGTLRLGRPGGNPIAGTAESQHYGFIDDVAVFNVPLSQNQIQSLINAPRLLGNEANLHAGWTFDAATPSGGNLPQKLARPVVYRTITSTGTVVSPFPHTALVSQARDNAADEKFLKFPNNQVALTLPFPKGEAWAVGQGWQGTISHSGRAAFAWDFNLAGQPASATNGKPYYAAAPGPVIELQNNRTSCSGYPANHVDVRHAPDEIGVYLHHVKGTAAVSLNQNVAVGTKLANAGDTGNTGCGSFHVHFALHNKTESNAGDLVTIPGTFEKYEVSTDSGASWSLVTKGIPKQGEWIRNPP